MPKTFLALALLCLSGSALRAQDVRRIQLAKLMATTDPAKAAEAFADVDSIFPVVRIERAAVPFQFEKATRGLDAVSYRWGGEERSALEFLERTKTTSFVAIADDVVVHEMYFRAYTPESAATSMSVAKSFVSALAGIALAEGHIGSVDDPIDEYVPELSDSGYKGVPIRHVLQMSSGIDFVETYDDASSDLTAMMMQLAGGRSVLEYAARLPSREPSGRSFNYASVDTAVLGILLERATGTNPADYLEDRIWKRIGTEADASWATDNHGNVLGFAWLNATPMDYARFGRLYLHDGRWEGVPIVPEDWIRASVVPSEEHLRPGALYGPEWDIGYQYQWWVPGGDEGEFLAIGIWGQFIYVNPSGKLVMVKTGADPLFDTHEMETVEFFRGVGAAVGDPQ